MRIVYFAIGFVVMATAAAFVSRNLFPNPPPAPVGFHSGPQAGDKLPGTFELTLANGPKAGEIDCMICAYGSKPVVLLFAPTLTPAVESLVRKLEAAAAGRPVGACLVVTNPAEEVRGRLAQFSEQTHLQHVTLGTIEPKALKHYKLGPDATLTVLFYKDRVIARNQAFEGNEPMDKSVDELGHEAARFFGAE
jgi:hypothetical protein